MEARKETSTPSSVYSDRKIRKRVYKACDRCRLKKSKCDESNPCSLCRTNDSLCTFGKLKKGGHKGYPEGYVEVLEQQHVWLVHGLQELYQRTIDGENWSREPPVPEHNKIPPARTLLTWLDILDSGNAERFEQDVDIIQQTLKCNEICKERQISACGFNSPKLATPTARLLYRPHDTLLPAQLENDMSEQIHSLLGLDLQQDSLSEMFNLPEGINELPPRKYVDPCIYGQEEYFVG